MSAYDSLPDAVTEVFGADATAERAYDLLTVDVPPASWVTALTTARDELGCTYFDWLSAVDEPGTGFRVCAHVVALGEGAPKRLLLRTTVPHEAPVLPTAIGVYAGAGWHERETHEMFGVAFEGHPHLVPLLLPENFEGHPLRKDFVLAARVAKAWPGAKEPGESHDGGGPKRRQMLPPGVPDPNEWGPLKGQLPPAPARPARAAAGDRPARAAAGDRPVRRARTATEGSASQAAPEAGAPVRRSRTASEGSASQATPEQPGTPEAPAEAPRPPRRSRSAADGSASQAAPEAGPGTDAPPATARPPRRSRSAADGSASQAAPQPTAPEPAAPEPGAPEPTASEAPAPGDGPASRGTAATPRTRSSDAPWHHARPAFDEPSTEPEAPAGTDGPEAEKAEAAEAGAAGPEVQKPRAAEAGAAEPEAPEAEATETEAAGVGAPEPGAADPEAPETEAARATPAGPPAGPGADQSTDTAGGDPA
ncbi:NADH-quinone oxidoreductase subunit C [Streptomyces sp. NPDC096319]|uniref:NADH-quinone oxidoreductase subunit C n=1 Tax=Streptomyces sp. NPDC096319 TaxID=3366084 RepID=UPI0038096944